MHPIIYPNVISTTNHKCVARFKWPNASLHAQTTRALEQTDMETCHVSMTAWCSFQLVKNCKPWNMSLKIRTLKLPHQKHVKFRRHNSTRILMPGQPKPPKHIPPKHVTFRELCFGPIHAPWPIHDALDLFQLSHTSYNFRRTIVSRQLMKVME